MENAKTLARLRELLDDCERRQTPPVLKLGELRALLRAVEVSDRMAGYCPRCKARDDWDALMKELGE